MDFLHGHRIADPYRWLEDPSDPRCATWLKGQADVFARHAAAWPEPQQWRARLSEAAEAGSTVLPVESTPVLRADRYFFLHRAPGTAMPTLMTAAAGQEPRVLVDPLTLDRSGTTALSSWRPSPGGSLVACQLIQRNDERPVLRVFRVPDGRPADSPLAPGRATPVAWLPDDSGFFYVDTPDSRLSTGRRLRLHRLGTRPADDPVLFTTSLPQLTVTASPDGRWLMLSAAPGATSGNLLWLADLPGAPVRTLDPVLIHDGSASGARALLKFGPDGHLYSITDDGAGFGRMCAVDPAQPQADCWRTLIAEQPGHVLADCALLTSPVGTGPLAAQSLLLVTHTRHGRSTLSLHAADGTALDDIPTPGPGAISRLTAPPHGGPRAWFSYTDFTTPPAVYLIDVSHEPRVPLPSPPLAGPVSPAGAAPRAHTRSRSAAPVRPRVRELTYNSADGTPVRMHLITPALPPAGTPPRGEPRATLLTAYGGFGASTLPAYSPAILAWVQAGGSYAIAHVRGGGEEGTAWHAAGSGHNKPTAINDLNAAAEYLIEHGCTTPARLAVRGSSHSGFLAAAAITARPDLYAAAVISDAVTDMIRYHHFGIARLWTREFGTADDPGYTATLLSYSPYHRVQPGTRYPPTLLTTTAGDSRVNPLHTRKMAAALQHAVAAAPSPVLLRCQPGTSHGPPGPAQWLDLQADILAFCAAHTGLANQVTGKPAPLP